LNKLIYSSQIVIEYRHIFRKNAHLVGKSEINTVIVSQTWKFWI